MKSNGRVIEKFGNAPGKYLVVLVGIYGNEICGVRAIKNLLPKLNIKNGKVVFIYANLEAIKQNKRLHELI